MKGSRWAAIVSLSVAACGSSSSGGASGTVGGAPSTLVGTWDFTGTEGSEMSAGTIAIAATSITIAANGGTMTLSRDGDALSISYSDADTNESAAGAQTGGGAVSLGALPFDVSGTVSMTETTADRTAGACAGTLAAGSLTAMCAGVGRPPRPLPRHLNGSVSATRTVAAQSMFGDLGGTWTGTGSDGVSCTVGIQGAGISSTCTGSGKLVGSLTMVFSGDVASGTTSAGVEFSAHRR